MYRFACAALLLLSFVFSGSALAQSTLPSSDPTAISIVQQAMTALTGGLPVTDVTLNGNVTSIAGSDSETGTGTFKAKGASESRIDLSVSGVKRSEVRNASNGIPAGQWNKNAAKASAFAQHNCWTDAAWFFPALSSLTQTANSRFVFKYVGQEQLNNIAVQHISVFQFDPQDTTGVLQRLSSMDFYLATASLLPVAIEFKGHADKDMNTNLPNQILFANWQAVNGIEVPFHFQRLINGVVVLDVTVSSARFNVGIPDSTFSLP